MNHTMTTFYELKNCSQRPDEPRRRWFTTNRQDLIVWLGESGTIVGFRYAYDREDDVYSLSWSTENGCQYSRVDTGDQPGHPRTPMLMQTRRKPEFDLEHRFARASMNMDPQVARFVQERIRYCEASN